MPVHIASTVMPTYMVMLPVLGGFVGWLGTRRLANYLHPFQQEEYNTHRFIRWWREKKALDRWTTVGFLMAMSFTTWPMPQAQTAATGFALLWLCWRMVQEPDATKPGSEVKKPLVLTRRATLIWALASAFSLILLLAAITLPKVVEAKLIALIVYLQLLPFVLLLANALLWPIRYVENRKYLTEARDLIARLNPMTVGITGSFGKTSTKFILTHILSGKGPVLMTPGSVNTPLGISRIIREQLGPQHGTLVAEMGAYGPGSIARLCKLVPPKLSCITAVGEAHYERFRSLARVARAKFEIAEATHAQGGVCVLNIDGIPDNIWQPRVEAKPEGYILVGSTPEHIRKGDILIEKVEELATGLRITLGLDGEPITISSHLYGRVQAGNMAVAFAMARQLGMAPAHIAAALKTAPAAPHRLNVKPQDNQVLIDDSYNANPLGFKTALETLSLVANNDEKHRRILVTPGMVELGALEASAHIEVAQTAIQHADVIIAVGPKRMPEFVETLEQAQQDGLYLGQLVQVTTLAEAKEWLAEHGKPGDVILLENDLPDRYEARWTL
jgi:UDP-N-acetylmuramoyl-tripeptide--D-alanyl-D-alanine ligase